MAFQFVTVANRFQVREDRIETMNRNNNPNQLVSVSSGQYMGVRDSLSNSVPYATRDTGRMILHDGNQAVVSVT